MPKELAENERACNLEAFSVIFVNNVEIMKGHGKRWREEKIKVGVKFDFEFVITTTSFKRL